MNPKLCNIYFLENRIEDAISYIDSYAESLEQGKEFMSWNLIDARRKLFKAKEAIDREMEIMRGDGIITVRPQDQGKKDS